MSANDEVLLPSSDSFWEIDSYKTTVKRTEDGLHMCGELMKLIAERSEIEMKYSSKLKMWCKKWSDIIEKGPEYGTNNDVLLRSLREADAMGELHSEIKDQLMDVHNELKKWKNENFKKAMVGGCKETKQFEDDFKKAQKPWAKKLAKVQKCKKDYYNACKQEVASQQALNQTGAGAVTDDQAKKLQEKVEKCQRDVSQTRDKYEDTLKDLNTYKPIYIIDMKEVFDNTQEFEKKRLEYFKETLIGIHLALDLTQTNKLSKISNIYKEFQQTIGLSDASKDLTWWSQNRGADMPMNWPEFEEFSSEPSSLTRKDKSRSSVPISSNNDTIRSLKSPSPNLAGKEPVQESKAATAGVVVSQTPSKTSVQRKESYDPDLNPFQDEPDSNIKGEAKKPKDPSGGASEAGQSDGKILPKNAGVPQTSNPFDDDDDDDEEEEEKEDFSNQVGVPVQALFDYVGQEKDELSFKSGDKFEKLKDRDEQGWCTGRRDGQIGLFPDNYVKVIDQ